MASKATFIAEAVGSTPATGLADVRIDSVTKRLASFDDAGVETNYGEGGGGGSSSSSTWKTDVSDQTAPPKDKRIEWNNVTQSSATELFIDNNDKSGNDVSAFLALVAIGNHIRIQQSDNAGLAQVFEVTSTTDNTTYFTYGVTNVSAFGGNISDNKDVIVSFIAAGDLPDHASNHETGGSDPVSLGNMDGTVPIGSGGTGQVDSTSAFNALSPAVTKGDTILSDGSDNIKLGVGTNGQVYTADSAEASGVKWATPTTGMSFSEFPFFSDQFLNPNNSDWAVNALAPDATDSNDAALSNRGFDDTVEEGVGYKFKTPSTATSLVTFFQSRAETAPPAVRTVGLKLYVRKISGTVGSWDAGTPLDDIDIATNENYVDDTQTISFATLGITAGETYIFQLTRISPTAGTNLVGDWDLQLNELTFT